MAKLKNTAQHSAFNVTEDTAQHQIEHCKKKNSNYYIAKERSKESKETAKQEKTQRSMISTAKGSAAKHRWAAQSAAHGIVQ